MYEKVRNGREVIKEIARDVRGQYDDDENCSRDDGWVKMGLHQGSSPL